jgi:lipopolysaccharide transport system ATP-binding protein
MTCAIRAEGLGKLYQIGQLQNGHTLRDSLLAMCQVPLRAARRRAATGGSDNEIWALSDATFEIQPGEVVGLIGRNGAGKSTLLKILSRITEPTCGRAEVDGRVGSLLEVGTGFHNELTGRENIFLYGAILGMHKHEIGRKFDEIVEFSQIGKFLDTPVKHYSSGMHMRLAFSVAAHLDPEILLVDEVLAVGDSRFQRKCLNKMEDVAHGGRTIIFVSHNISAITRICRRAISLEDGRIIDDGAAHEVASRYMTRGLGTRAVREWHDLRRAPGGPVCRLTAVRIRNQAGETADTIDIREPVGIEIEYEVLEPGHIFRPDFHLWNDDGVRLFVALDQDPLWRRRRRPAGRFVSTGWIPGNFLAEGHFFADVTICALDPEITLLREASVVSFQVVDSMEGDSSRGDYGGHLAGVVRPKLHWTTQHSLAESTVS